MQAKFLEEGIPYILCPHAEEERRPWCPSGQVCVPAQSIVLGVLHSISACSSLCWGLSVPPQILRDTGVFEHTWKELELWLEQVDCTKAEQRETVIKFLERVSVTNGGAGFYLHTQPPGAMAWWNNHSESRNGV